MTTKPQKREKIDVRTALRRLVTYLEHDPELYDGDDDGVLGKLMYAAKAALRQKRRMLGGGPGEDPEYPRCDWQYEVANGDTSRGYWDWVDVNKEIDENDPNFPKSK